MFLDRPLTSARIETLESRVLEGNPLGDPARREVAVYVPPSGHTEGLPLLLHLPGFAGSGAREAQRARFLDENLFDLFDRLVRSGACPEAVLVAPDCRTMLGGSQYVNSPATGRYADFVTDEVVPWAQESFRTGAVGVLGQSSGGFGALHLATERPGLFAAVGSSSGDMAFDLVFLPEVPRAVRAYREHGGPEAFLSWLLEQPGRLGPPTDPSASALLLLAMGACYSPRQGMPTEVDLPFDTATGELVEPVWRRWLAFDPVERLHREGARDALRGLRRLHLTASSRDEWFADLGVHRFVRRLKHHRIPVVHDVLPGGHFDKRARFERLFPSLVGALTSSDPPR